MENPRDHILAVGSAPDLLSSWYQERSASGVGIRQTPDSVPFVVDVPKIDAEARGTADMAAPGMEIGVSVEVKRVDGLEADYPVTGVRVVIGDPETNGDANMSWNCMGQTYVQIPGTTTTLYPQAKSDANFDIVGFGVFPFDSAGLDWAGMEGNTPTGVARWSYAYNIEDQIALTDSGPGVDNEGYTLWSGTIDTTGLRSQDYYLGIFVEATGDRRDFLFDNLSGFTLEPYSADNNVLLVDDYVCGQRCKQSLAPFRGNYGPNEEASYATVGYPVESYLGRTVMGTYKITGESINRGSCHTVLGTMASWDYAFVAMPTWEPGYDKWRVACRGPIPYEVLVDYLPADHYVWDPTPDAPPQDDTYGIIDGPAGDHPGFPVFTATVDANGFATRPDPTKDKSLLFTVADRGVAWFAPYSGDLVLGTESGHITDAATQAGLRDFVSEGGRLFVSGQDLGWALTLNGSIATPPFFTGVLGASFVRDDLGNPNHTFSGGAGVSCTATGGFNPVANGPRAGWPVLYADSHPTALHTNWSRNRDPNGPFNDDGAYQNEWPDVIAPASSTEVYSYNAGGSCAVRKEGFPREGKTVYMSFGLEAVHREFYETPGPVFWCDNFRHKILMYTMNWFRTSTIYGRVTTSASSDLPPGSPREGAVVVATDQRTGITYALFTDSLGNYRFRGLPVSNYTMTAQYSGELADHPASTETWGKGPIDVRDPRLALDPVAVGTAPYYDTTFQRREDFNLLPAPPGAIEGHVYANLDLNGDTLLNDPVANIEVRATSLTLDPPLNGNPVFDQVVKTDADGYFFIETVPVDTYDVHGNPRKLLNYSDQLIEDVIVQAGQTANVDFFLDPLPGTIQGTVTDKSDNSAIPGANVKIAALGLSVTSDSNGAYEIDPVPAGDHTVDVDAPGYLSAAADVTLLPGGTVTQNFQLEAVPPGIVKGRVTDSTGTTGIPGVLVRALFGTDPVTDPGPATTDANGDYSLELPASTYTIQAYDPNGEAAYAPVDGIEVQVLSDQTVEGIDFQVIPQATIPAGLHVIGPAYNYEGRSPAGIFGVAQAGLKLARWVPIRGEYAIYTPTDTDPEVARLLRGNGYFVQFDNRVDISAVGTPGPEDQEGRRALVPILTSPAAGGWNLIGNPYDYDIDFSLTRIQYQNQELSLSEAAAAGVVSDVLFTYENGYRESNLLPAWRGGWIRVNEPDVVIALSNQRVLSRDASVRSQATLPRGMDWKVRLLADAEGCVDHATWIGASSTATKGYDPAFDVPEPPSVRHITGREVSVYFPRTDLGVDSGRYTADVRGRIREAESWDAVVQAYGVSGDVTLSWPDMRSLPRYYTATLTDLDTGRQVNMRTAENYAFTPDETGLRNVRVTIRYAQAGGGLVIENTGQTRGLSTVTYRAVSDATVDVKVLNAAGRIIRRLVEGEVRAAGRHTETWDGHDDRGVMVPDGYYTFEVQGVFGDGTTTRAMTRVLR